MDLYLNGLKEEITPELEAFRKEFEDNYDDIVYLRDLGNRLSIYNKEYPVREGYIL
jgi:hypothetical protein